MGLSPSEASLTGCIIAEHQTSGAEVTLNSGYTITISPFPQKGETTPVSEVVALQFPTGSQSGTYSVVGELIEAKVKAIGIWWDVTDYLPSSEPMGSLTYTASSGGGGGSWGGGGGTSTPTAPTLAPGTSDVSDFVSTDGAFTEAVVTESADALCKLSIDEGTKGLTRRGAPLTEITMTEMEEPPSSPEDSNVIGLVYDLGPDKATFDPPIILTFTYDESLIPEGVVEENLVIAIWDEETSEWVNLDCAVDPETNAISAEISHFTSFTVLAYTRPAAFVASDLSITPIEVDIGDGVTISALVANTGDLAGTYEVILKINNVVIDTKGVTLDGGASQTVTFTTSRDIAGSYTVNVDALSGTFVVKPPPAPAAFTTSALSVTPAEVDIEERVTISVLVANTGDLADTYKVTLKINNVVVDTKDVTLDGGASQKVTFVISRDVAGSYTVNVDALSGTFVVKAAPPPPVSPVPPKPIDWWLIGSIIAGCITIGVVIALVVRRQGA